MRASVCVVELNREQQPFSLAAARRAEREDTCFKDVSRRVMKARHNEAERPCSYLQSIDGALGGVVGEECKNGWGWRCRGRRAVSESDRDAG